MKILSNNTYLLLIDEEAEIISQEGQYIDKDYNISSLVFYPEKVIAKIIAYYPLSKEAKELDLPLLPVTPRNEWGVHETHCCSKHGCKYGDNDCCVELGIAEQKYPCEFCSDEEQEFSLEDMKKAIEMARDYNDGWLYTEEEIIQSLSTQQLPKEFKPSYKVECTKTSCNGECGECGYMEKVLKTTTNSEGKEVLVGEYKY